MKQSKKNNVANARVSLRKIHNNLDFRNEIDARKRDIRSMIYVMQAALSSRDYDEGFYRENVGHMTYMLRDKFEELEILIDAYVKDDCKTK